MVNNDLSLSPHLPTLKPGAGDYTALRSRRNFAETLTEGP